MIFIYENVICSRVVVVVLEVVVVVALGVFLFRTQTDFVCLEASCIILSKTIKNIQCAKNIEKQPPQNLQLLFL